LTKKAFDKLLMEVIDDSLLTLGDSARQAIYFHLENKFKIARSDIPDHIEDFANGIEKIFGLGARFLEILIMKNLYAKVGQPLNWGEDKEFSFAEYVIVAKQSFLKYKKEN
jgi:hypothetical protein